MGMKQASRAKRIWFWLTCWRPLTKYEYVKLWEFFMKFCVAVEKDHLRVNKEIAELKMRIGVKEIKKEKENIERGMYQ